MIETEKDISLFCDVDENGMITHMLIGKYVNPISEYEYFFKIDKEQEANIHHYYVKDRKLTKITTEQSEVN